MDFYGYELVRESDLTHHGIKGQKWGVRRFQNEDGSLTAAGKKRQGNTSADRISSKINSSYQRSKKLADTYYDSPSSKAYKKAMKDQMKIDQTVRKYTKKYNIDYDKENDKFVASKKSKAQIKYDKAYKKNLIKAHNMAAQYLNGSNGELAKLNDKWKQETAKYNGNLAASPKYSQYVQEANKLIAEYQDKAMHELIGERPN